MILPTKHISFSGSLLGLGSYILSKLVLPQAVDDLWKEYLKDYDNDQYHAKHSFDNLILTLIFLYSIDAIREDGGIIYKCV